MDPTNANTALASAFVEELARCGMRRAVVSPGSRSTPLALALWRNPAVRVEVEVDERCAGFRALGAASATGTPVGVACTSGTAAANLHPAVAEADEAGVPLLALTADRPPELRGIGAGQTIDQVGLFGAAVRWFCEVGAQQADDSGLLHLRATACRAFAEAVRPGLTGPVHLNLAWREPLAPVPDPDGVTARSPLALKGRGGAPLTAVRTGTSAPDAAVLDALSERLATVRRGVIVAGREPRPGLAGAVAALAAATGFPILAEPTSQLRLGPHDRSRVIWAYDSICRAQPTELEPDFVLRFGDMPTSKPLRSWLAELPDAEQAVIDPPGRWNEPLRTAGTIVRADAPAVAAGLAERLADRPPAPASFADPWRAAQAAATAAIDSILATQGGPTEPGIHRTLARLVIDGQLVFTASSMPIRDQEAFWADGPADVRFLANRGANGIDGTVSTAVGAAASLSRPTVVVLGDLALHHDSNGLAGIKTLDVPVKLVVIDNAGGGIFAFLPQQRELDAEEFERLFATPVGLDPERLAALHGVGYHRVERLDDLGPLLAGRGHALIHVPVQRAGNVELHAQLADAVAEAVRDALGSAR
ncbi:MAG: 2-succinyl-5-enolpyruvyl-6-hydroxy-3-cyclohexene-1-carboxylic-acid synthase [Solirubrobacterales bacterium]